ncbi:MAG: ankyrin repeat domain-containing protein, partial [Kofleriaceae bacterium]|nr:ankyrin repeat domain-containing protein [Kofleriaceae bacterium]
MRTKMEKVAERLFAGAKVGNLKEVRGAVKSGASVNLVNDWDESTPLSWAALGGHTEVVRFLLEAGADPIGENTALIAIENLGEIIKSMGESIAETVSDIVKERVDGQKEIDAEFHVSKNIEVQPLATLPDPPSGDGEFDEDPDDDDDDDEGHPESAMCAAARAGSIEIMELLIAHGALVTDSEDSLRELPIAAAARGGHLQACQWLLDKGANGKANYVSSPIHSAAAGGNAEVVRLFLELGIDPNLPEAEDGYIPLHEVTTVAAAKVLVEAGAGTMVDYLIQGDSPMSCAGDSGNASLVEYLASLSQNQEVIDRAREQFEICEGIANKSTCRMIQASWSCNVARFQESL